VVVLEQRGRVGGATATEELVPGFRFSTCAYALHLLHERVADELGLELDLIESPEPTVVLPTGEALRADGSGARVLGELDSWRAWDRVWDEAATLVDTTLLGPPPAWESLDSPLADISMRELLERHFDSPSARALFARLYFEGDQDERGAPLAYAYVETSRRRDARFQGVPRGGMGTVADAFARAAERAGAHVHVCSEVLRTHPTVVVADGRQLTARAVLVNASPREPRPRGPVGAKVHCALRGEPDLSLLGAEREELGVVAVREEDGSLVELQLPSLRDDSLAPAGCHTLSIFMPRALPDALTRAERAIPNLRDILTDVVEHGPEELERRVGLTDGQVHHLPHVPAAMFDRRGGARTDVAGVYRCGAAAHPGGEVSGVPGWNAARAVLEDLS
jgi:phytoene dehydrogenase-like protein